MKLIKPAIYNARYSAITSFMFLKQKENPIQLLYDGWFKYYNNDFINFSMYPIEYGKSVEDVCDIIEQRSLSSYSRWMVIHTKKEANGKTSIKHCCRFINPMKKYKQVVL